MTGVQSTRRVAVFVFIALVIAACGTRADEAEFLALRGETSTGSGPTGAGSPGVGSAEGSQALPGSRGLGDSESTSSASGGSGAAPAGQNPGAPSDGGTGTPAASGQSPNSGDPTSPGPGGGPAANTASDVGVTPESIKIGNIVARGGALGPDAFSPMFFGARAYFERLNERGGVNGRKVEFITCDDKENPAQNKQCASDLIEGQKVFALAANASTTYASAKFISEQGVPDVGGQPVGDAYWTWPTHFPVSGSEGYPRQGTPGLDGKLYQQTNQYRYLKNQVGASRAAVFFYSIAASANAAAFLKTGMELEGIEVVFEPNSGVGRNPADPSYDGDVLQMQREGVDNVWNAIDVAGFQKLCQAMDRFSFTVKANVATTQSSSQKVGEDFSSPCRESIFSYAETRPYSEATHPAIAEFLSAMAAYSPNVDLHLWNVEGYTGAKMLTEGIASMGTSPTRVGLMKYLNDLRSYTADGLLAGIDFRPSVDFSKPALHCTLLAKWDEAKFTFAPHSEVFTCDTTNFFEYAIAGDQQ